MKHLFLLLALLFVGQASQAQQLDTAGWCPAGAMWLYGTTGFSAHFHAFVYEKDTVYQGVDTKKINQSVFQLQYNVQGNIIGRTDYGIIDNFFLYNSNDSLYYWNDSTNSFLLLYDFAMLQGDRLVLQAAPNNFCYDSDYPQTDTVIVDLQTSLNYSNWLIHTTYFDSYTQNTHYYNLDAVYKNIGGVNSFFPVPSVDSCSDFNYNITSLQCYQDNTRGAIEFQSNNGINCQSLISYVEAIEDKSIENNAQEILLYPNPNSGIAYFDDTHVEYPIQYELYDLSGKLVLTEKTFSNELNLSSLSNGIYLVRLSTSNGKTAFSKIIKQ